MEKIQIPPLSQLKGTAGSDPEIPTDERVYLVTYFDPTAREYVDIYGYSIVAGVALELVGSASAMYEAVEFLSKGRPRTPRWFSLSARMSNETAIDTIAFVRVGSLDLGNRQ